MQEQIKVNAIRKIYQKDNCTFTIEWNDGVLSDYRLGELQKHCPCAQCTDEYSGERLVDESQVDPNVRAERITSVGRYALRIDFTKGCSAGIYSFDMLRD